MCLLSIVLAPVHTDDALPGFIYFLLGPLQWFNGRWFGRKAAKLAPAAVAAAA